MKLVTIIPRFVINVSLDEINEICCPFEVKTKLESLAVKLVVQRIDTEKLKAREGVIQGMDGVYTSQTINK